MELSYFLLLEKKRSSILFETWKRKAYKEKNENSKGMLKLNIGNVKCPFYSAKAFRECTESYNW